MRGVWHVCIRPSPGWWCRFRTPLDNAATMASNQPEATPQISMFSQPAYNKHVCQYTGCYIAAMAELLLLLCADGRQCDKTRISCMSSRDSACDSSSMHSASMTASACKDVWKRLTVQRQTVEAPEKRTYTKINSRSQDLYYVSDGYTNNRFVSHDPEDCLRINPGSILKLNRNGCQLQLR